MADMKTLSDGTTTYNVADPTKLPLSGGTMTGNINANEVSTVTNLKAPTDDLDAATKKYVDDEIASAIANLVTTSQMTTAIQEAIANLSGGGS